MTTKHAALAALVLASLCLSAAAAATVHTVFTTECANAHNKYFTWQSLGMMYSHRKSGQPGRITRLMSCTKEELDALSEEEKTIAPTHFAPSFTRHPRTGDVYSAYNKPVAIMDWLAKTKVEEEYILILDADMIMRAPFLPDELGAAPGRGVSAFYGYLKGVANALALKHVPEVTPRNDTDAGPVGRRGDQVGGFILQHQSDLRRMVPYWIKFSEDVRADPDAWELSGDSYATHPGDKPWISEMYGYSFGAAKANVWHKCHHTAMLYPGYETTEPPKVLHYGLLWEVADTGYKFDKHWHYDFDPLVCPPWQALDSTGVKKVGLFPHPPSPASFQTKGLQLLRDLLSVEVVITLNEAFCQYQRSHCPPSKQLADECDKAQSLAFELEEAYRSLELPDPCSDTDPSCPTWAAAGECNRNSAFMLEACRLSCGVCQTKGSAPRAAAGGVGGATGLQNPVDKAAAAGVAGAGMGRTEEAIILSQGRATNAPSRAGTGTVGLDGLAGQGQQQDVQPRNPSQQRAAGEANAAPDLTGGAVEGDTLTRPGSAGAGGWQQQQQQQQQQYQGQGQAAPYRQAGEGTAAGGGSGGAGQAAGEGWRLKGSGDAAALASLGGEGSRGEDPETVKRRREAAVVQAEAAERRQKGDAGAQAVVSDKASDKASEKGGRKMWRPSLHLRKLDKGRLLQEKLASTVAKSELMVTNTARRLQKFGTWGLALWALALMAFLWLHSDKIRRLVTGKGSRKLSRVD